jgi:rare lipoprotein A
LAVAEEARVRVQILPDESRQIAAALTGGGALPVGSSDGAPVASPRGTVAAAPLAPPTAGGGIATAPPPTARPPSLVGRTVAPPPDPTGQLSQGAPQPTRLFVQAGAFSSAANADRLVTRLRSFGPTFVSPISINGVRLWRVRVGPVTSVREGDQLLARLLASGFPDARLIAD